MACRFAGGSVCARLLWLDTWIWLLCSRAFAQAAFNTISSAGQLSMLENDSRTEGTLSLTLPHTYDT